MRICAMRAGIEFTVTPEDCRRLKAVVRDHTFLLDRYSLSPSRSTSAEAGP